MTTSRIQSARDRMGVYLRGWPRQRYIARNPASFAMVAPLGDSARDRLSAVTSALVNRLQRKASGS